MRNRRTNDVVNCAPSINDEKPLFLFIILISYYFATNKILLNIYTYLLIIIINY